MELKFNGHRLAVIRRLKNLTVKEIEDKMAEIGGFTSKFHIDRWSEHHAPNNFEKVKLLAKALDVPVGFFYYNNVEINMKNLKVEIMVHETGEKVEFDF